MDRTVQLEVFRAQTLNVRRLASAIGLVRRTIHGAMRRGDQQTEEAHCLMYGLLYCAWLEALFLKLVHTPHGFSLEEIEQLSRTQDKDGMHAAWRHCVELGLRHVPGVQAGDVANMRQTLQRLLKTYVEEPAVLRNKIAHGQWQVALNRQRTAVNPSVTAQLALLDIVTIDKQRFVAGHIVAIVEALLESPERHFRVCEADDACPVDGEP
jgi:hypothetical protein